jgi:hypothetical protein
VNHQRAKSAPGDMAGRASSVSGQGQNRTADTQIFSLLLYQLSYLAERPWSG